ncbi:DUF4839 domain-containing protein [Actinoplanes sp. URMC 104]|uniref:DUF4839 domain-containing protein n=1 Tax=Actinoplanes sp. URMC 104 TaxID=3423409 RepID=UPI003F1D59C3
MEQSAGTLRSTLTFRQPKKPLPWLLIGTAAAVLVIVAVVISIGAAFSNGGKTNEPARTTAAPADKPSATPIPTTAKPAAVKVITALNNPEFAALLRADSCDDANEKFATRHAGQTITFDGSIVDMAAHGDYDTRFDLLLGPDDKGPETTAGPAFKYEDVGILDLNLTGAGIPAAVGEGDKFRFVAKVGEFDPVQCVFLLDPVSTAVR